LVALLAISLLQRRQVDVVFCATPRYHGFLPSVADRDPGRGTKIEPWALRQSIMLMFESDHDTVSHIMARDAVSRCTAEIPGVEHRSESKPGPIMSECSKVIARTGLSGGMMKTLQSQIVVDNIIYPEGIRWSRGLVWFSDILASKVYTYDPA